MRTLVGMLAVAALLIVGCDGSSTPDPVQQAATEARSSPPPSDRPTTQQLLQGPRKRLALTPIPFSAAVPPSWKIESLGGGTIVMLDGPTPSGEAQVQLSTHPPAKKEEFERIQRGAAKEKAERPKTVIKADFRQIGNIEVLERQVIGTPGPMTIMDAEGHEHTETATSFTWTLTFFIPQGDGFARSELSFIGLTKEQLESDKPLLTEIVDSLQYDPSAGATTRP